MYQNPYLQSINQQNINEKIDSEIQRLQQMKNQIQQPIQPITQNFQLAPSHNGIKYANTIDDVKKEIVYVDTPFFSKDLSIMWLKTSKGDVRPFELKEIVEKDEKDLMIDSLQIQINELRKELNNAKSNNNDGVKSIKDEKSSNVSNVKSRKN